MVKFVWLNVAGGGRVPVNPDQVQHLRQTREGATALVFGAFNGGFHEILAADDVLAVMLQLEGLTPGAPAPPGARSFPRAKRRPQRAQAA